MPFIYKNHDILRYVTFLYKKSERLCKKHDNLHYILYTEIQTLCLTQFFIKSLKLVEGGGQLYMQRKNLVCVKFLYAKK